MTTDPIAVAVAAERARAAEAVREIVERWAREETVLIEQGMLSAAGRALARAEVALECLAAVEAQR